MKFKCTECPSDKRNRVLYNGCKYDHERESSHKSFDEIITSGRCECDCITNKTRVIVEAHTWHEGHMYTSIEEEGSDKDEDEEEH